MKRKKESERKCGRAGVKDVKAESKSLKVILIYIDA